MCHFWVQNAPFVLNKESSVKIVNITTIYLLIPFSVQIFKIFLRGDPELWGWTIFGSKLVHLPQTRTFWGKIINIISISSTYWTLSLYKIFKYSYNGSRVWACAIFGPKMGLFAQTIFFQKNLVPIIHAHLHPKRILKSHWLRVTFRYNLRILFFSDM